LEIWLKEGVELNSVEMLKEMFLLQQKLNDETNGKGWEKGYTKNNKIINWQRCIYMECAELIDSFSWKHWKDIDKEPNWDNIRVEIVDIWHFVMSLAIEQSVNNHLGDIDDIINYIYETKEFKEFEIDPKSDKAEQYEIINIVEDIIHKATSRGDITYKAIIAEYFILAHNCGIGIEGLYDLYIAKNILNKFRQDNGYKEGSYIKNWQGKEDNDIMLELLKIEKDMNKLYKLLEKEYSKVDK
jgi:dimeric dUTPase (all-alpha-NTP-PPase superfamily)